MQGIKRGDIWIATSRYASEGCKQELLNRPVVVVSNDIGNEHSDIVEVVLLTTKIKKIGMPTHTMILHRPGGLERDSMALCEQIMTLSQSDLINRIGSVTPEEMRRLECAIRVSLGV